MSPDEPWASSPEEFVEAAEAFCGWAYEWRDGALSAHRVTKALTRLANAGLIVSPAQHESLAADYAGQLSRVEDAAAELVRRLHGDEE